MADYRDAFESWDHDAFGPAGVGFEAYETGQLEELLTEYDQIDLLSLDGYADPLKATAWELEARVLVTRGEMETPDLTHGVLPEDIRDEAWEACMTMQHRAWAYKRPRTATRISTAGVDRSPNRPPPRDARQQRDPPAQRRARTGRPPAAAGRRPAAAARMLDDR